MIKREKKLFKSCAFISAFFLISEVVPTTVYASTIVDNDHDNTTSSNSLSNLKQLPALSLENQFDISNINNEISTTSLTEARTSSANLSYNVIGTTNVGNTLTVEITANSISNLYGASIDFLYDSNIIEVQSVAQGNLFSGKISTPLISKIENGQVNLAMSLTGASTPISGSGTLATLKIKILKPGTVKFTTTNDYHNLSLNNYTSCIKLSDRNGEKIGYGFMDKSISCSEFAFNSISIDKASPQIVNSNINITANTLGSDITHEFWVTDGSSWTKLYEGPNSTIAWKPNKAGTYTINAYAKTPSGNNVMKSLTYTIKDDFSFTSVTTDKQSPQVANSNINITANTTGDGINYEFWITDGSTWTKAYQGTNNKITWKPTKAGTYTINVYAKTSNGNNVMKSLTYTIKDAFSFTSVTTDKQSPQVANSSINITANTTGDNINYEFWITDGSSWTKAYEGANNKITWKPTKAGTYTINVYAKTPDGGNVMKTVHYTVTNAFSFSSVTADKTSPQHVNSDIKITANTTGEGITYEFWITDGSSWTKAYQGSNNTITWKPTKGGNYTINVYAKTSAGDNVMKTLTYKVNEDFSFSSITTDKEAPQASGSTINVTANTTGTDITYEFWINSGSSWTKAYQGSSNTYAWKPLTSGVYNIDVYAKTPDGKSVKKSISYIIDNSFNFTSITTDKKSPQISGSTINITANASGEGLVYEFWINIGSSWTKVYQGTKNTFAWKPEVAGNYNIDIYAKNQAGATIKKSISYSVANTFSFNSITTDKQSPQVNGESINITANTSGDNLTYDFWVTDGADWTRIYHGSKNSFTWIPTKAGNYTIDIYAKTESGEQIKKSISYVVK